MKRHPRLWNKYLSQLEEVIAAARADPNYNPEKWAWQGWNCWIAGYRAGQRSVRAKRATARRSGE